MPESSLLNMVHSREEAVRRAEADHSNVPGTCQLWVRTLYGAPSAGDQDGDGDADAVDGWRIEPNSKCHTDRHPPRGVPVAWSGGSHGNGHRAISVGDGKVRSTDAGGEGHIATVDLGWFERNWGLHYLGWSETIDGVMIPGGTPPPKTSRGGRVEHAINDLGDAHAKGHRKVLIDRARAILKRLPFVKR